jgi:hypothetical protein
MNGMGMGSSWAWRHRQGDVRLTLSRPNAIVNLWRRLSAPPLRRLSATEPRA